MHTHTHRPPPYQRCWFATFGPCCLLANITLYLTATCLVTSGQSTLSSLTPLLRVTIPTDISLTSLRSISSVRLAAKGVRWGFPLWQQWLQDVCSQNEAWGKRKKSPGYESLGSLLSLERTKIDVVTLKWISETFAKSKNLRQIRGYSLSIISLLLLFICVFLQNSFFWHWPNIVHNRWAK